MTKVDPNRSNSNSYKQCTSRDKVIENQAQQQDLDIRLTWVPT